ncbi:hypothetical protein KUTeg_019306 [Tegillarca granosa]|uniref:Sulfotransferase n=1 Tax=Tegillarca granosa TaxID=220873 RepID=A0ABQ9EHK3_TEGGR|nr:hypothetical protein KUTeg_019306 [Tegillarca granosa]
MFCRLIRFVTEFILNREQISFVKKGFYSPHLNNTRMLKNVTNATSRAKILILTYMRSGSTLTGDIMQQDPQSFYLFEPFRLIAHGIRDGKEFSYLNGQKRNHYKYMDSR